MAKKRVKCIENGEFENERFSNGELFYKLITVDDKELLVLHADGGGVVVIDPKTLKTR
jgi:hypothetical protein